MPDDKPVQPSQSASGGDGVSITQVGRDFNVTHAAPLPAKQSTIVSPTNSQIAEYDPNVYRVITEARNATKRIAIISIDYKSIFTNISIVISLIFSIFSSMVLFKKIRQDGKFSSIIFDDLSYFTNSETNSALALFVILPLIYMYFAINFKYTQKQRQIKKDQSEKRGSENS